VESQTDNELIWGGLGNLRFLQVNAVCIKLGAGLFIIGPNLAIFSDIFAIFSDIQRLFKRISLSIVPVIKKSVLYIMSVTDLYFTVVLTVEQMGNIVSLIPIFYQSSIFQIILLASSRGGR
jgi:hypothetical protein